MKYHYSGQLDFRFPPLGKGNKMGLIATASLKIEEVASFLYSFFRHHQEKSSNQMSLLSNFLPVGFGKVFQLQLQCTLSIYFNSQKIIG